MNILTFIKYVWKPNLRYVCTLYGYVSPGLLLLTDISKQLQAAVCCCCCFGSLWPRMKKMGGKGWESHPCGTISPSKKSENTVQCVNCKTDLTYNQSTSSMLQHLKRKHPLHYKTEELLRGGMLYLTTALEYLITRKNNQQSTRFQKYSTVAGRH